MVYGLIEPQKEISSEQNAKLYCTKTLLEKSIQPIWMDKHPQNISKTALGTGSPVLFAHPFEDDMQSSSSTEH
jgi:hypothetical protein